MKISEIDEAVCVLKTLLIRIAKLSGIGSAELSRLFSAWTN